MSAFQFKYHVFCIKDFPIICTDLLPKSHVSDRGGFWYVAPLEVLTIEMVGSTILHFIYTILLKKNRQFELEVGHITSFYLQIKGFYVTISLLDC